MAEGDDGEVTLRGEHERLAEEQAGVFFFVVGAGGVAAEIGETRRPGEAQSDPQIHLLAVQIPLELKVDGSMVFLVDHVSDAVEEDFPPVLRRRRIIQGRRTQRGFVIAFVRHGGSCAISHRRTPI